MAESIPLKVTEYVHWAADNNIQVGCQLDEAASVINQNENQMT